MQVGRNEWSYHASSNTVTSTDHLPLSTPFTFDNQIPKFNVRQMLLILLANIMVIGRFITFIGKCMFYLVPFRHCCCILKEQALARIISGAVTEDYLEEQEVEEQISSKLLRTERKEGKATGPGCQCIKSIEHSCES